MTGTALNHGALLAKGTAVADLLHISVIVVTFMLLALLAKGVRHL